MAERMVDVHGVELCTESFGDPADPPVLLIMGIGGSMLWWEEGFCRMLADGGRFVIRYDHRDTGRSVTYEPGRPGYTGADLVADAAGVLDAYGIPAAHVVGVSAGGAFAQLLALDFPERVLSLVLISTSPATPGDRSFRRLPRSSSGSSSTAEVNWAESESVIEYLVGYERVLAGDQRPFDEPAIRERVRRDVERARDFRAAQNHDALPDGKPSRKPLSSITAPTLVVHGTADPMFPVGHGEALAEEIPGAKLLTLDGAGHGVDRRDWETIARAVLEHTAAGRGDRLGRGVLLCRRLDLALELVGVGIDLLLDQLVGALGRLLELLLDLRLADHDHRGASSLELVAELLEVVARDAAPEVAGQSAGAGADDRAADDRGREDDPDQAPTPAPVQAPCWVGFSVFVTRTLPSSSFRITAESKVPIAPAAWRSNTAS